MGATNSRPGTSFDDILNLYRFDRELRLLVMDAVERIEVAFRTCISNYMVVKGGPHWYLSLDHFSTKDRGLNFARKVMEKTDHKNGGSDVFLKHYFRKYKDPILPPSWMIAEVLSISAWSELFENLKLREDRKGISSAFGLNPEVLESWMHAISYTRNLCAHHSRLWNREFTIRPLIAKNFQEQLADNSRFFAQAFVIEFLLKKASPPTTWWDRLQALIKQHPFIDTKAMGFP